MVRKHSLPETMKEEKRNDQYQDTTAQLQYTAFKQNRTAAEESPWNGQQKQLQSTLVISKGSSEIFRDIRTSRYKICRIEEKINQTTTFHKSR